MTHMGKLVALALLAASILSGCVFVPVDGWHGYRGGRDFHRDGYSYHRE